LLGEVREKERKLWRHWKRLATLYHSTCLRLFLTLKRQLQEALVSTIAAIDPSLDDSFCATEATEATEAMEATEDTLALQADYIPLNASDMELDYLDADDDVDTGLF
jgi:hypothetical protein